MNEPRHEWIDREVRAQQRQVGVVVVPYRSKVRDDRPRRRVEIPLPAVNERDVAVLGQVAVRAVIGAEPGFFTLHDPFRWRRLARDLLPAAILFAVILARC